MPMTDAELRDLANRFFDAYETHRLKDVAETWAEDMVIWYCFLDHTVMARDRLAGLEDGWAKIGPRTYNDRVINTFPGGFVAQFTLNGKQPNGYHGHLSACFVCQCSDGKITRMDQYLDAGGPPSWRGPD